MQNAFFARRTIFTLNLFSTRRSAIFMMILVPVFLGTLSVFYGQASGWDFYNYHVYNGYAYIHGRLNLDLAPGGFQSYFNPLLDAVYYLMSENLPPKVVGFLMGFVPALVFIPLWLLVYFVLSRSSFINSDVLSLATVIALVGVFSTSFVARTGSVDGDSVTTIFQMWALYFILRFVVNEHFSSRVIFWLLLAGVISGLGSGLKLTGVAASIALCIGLLFIGRKGMSRLSAPFLFGLGVLSGLMITGGDWFFKMYQHFGNPLFPQFGSFFPSDLASSVNVIDKRYLPSGFLDFLVWPFEFLLNPSRLSGDAWPQIIWPVFYILGFFFLIKKIRDFFSFSTPWVVDSASLFVIIYTVVGFVVWMFLFSIYRYQVYFVLTAPLVIFIFMRYVFNADASIRYMVFFSIFSILIALIFGIKSYEGEPWSDRYIQASPENAYMVPGNSTVLFVGQPIGWIAPFFPETASLVGIGNNFPVSDGYKARVRELIARNANTYAVFELPQSYRAATVRRVNSVLDFLKINQLAWGCHALKWLIEHSRLHASYLDSVGHSDGAQCGLVVSPADEVEFAQDRADAKQRAGATLAEYGYELGAASCVIRHAYVGARLFEFELCQLP